MSTQLRDEMENVMSETVREIAVKLPGTTRLFERLKIDYCCGGGRTLAEACAAAGVEPETVAGEIAEIRRAAGGEEQPASWEREPLSAVIRHIVERHHAFTRDELERIEKLAARVAEKHGARHPELVTVKALADSLKQDLLPHMLKEEQVLFPFIEKLEAAAASHDALQPPFFGTVCNPVRMMMTEHETAGEILRELRQVTNDYSTPDDACLSYRSLYRALEEFEADLHEHIHLENNLLFPRAIEMEAAIEPAWQAAAARGEGHRCFGH